MKTIFISVFQTFVSRNILNTGVLDELLSSGTRVVLFVPLAKEQFYKKTYNQSNVIVEAFDPARFGGKKEIFFKNFAELLISTKAMKFRKMKKLYLNKKLLRYIYQRVVTFLLGKPNYIKSFYRKLEISLNKFDSFDSYFKEYKPSVVFAPDVFGAGDVMLLKSALIHNVRNIAMVASWDNNTTKGLMRIIPDLLLVQNEIIRNESIEIQNVSEKIIQIVGIAHYDFYKQYKPISKKELFGKLGISEDKRLIVFSPAGSKFISTDWKICEIIKRAYAVKELPEDVVTLVRTHPTNPVDLENFMPDKHFIIETPGVSFEGLSDKRKELDKEALCHLLDTLHHSELVINVVSSIVIDAAVLDKPIITIGFDGWEKNVPFPTSVKRYHTDENMANLLSIGGTKVVKDEEELINAINNYLANPVIDKEGRKEIVNKQCWKLDGLAKTRIRDAILLNI